MKQILKVKLGDPVPSNAVFIKVEKECVNDGEGDYYSGTTFREIEWAYYEVAAERVPFHKQIPPHDCDHHKTYCHNDYYCDICGNSV